MRPCRGWAGGGLSGSWDGNGEEEEEEEEEEEAERHADWTLVDNKYGKTESNAIQSNSEWVGLR